MLENGAEVLYYCDDRALQSRYLKTSIILEISAGVLEVSFFSIFACLILEDSTRLFIYDHGFPCKRRIVTNYGSFEST